MGMVRVGAGSIAYDGEEILGQPPHRIARRGLGYVPEDRRVFARLSVQENLECGRQPPRAGTRTWSDNDLLDLFPNLAAARHRSEEHTSELQSLMRISYAVFCLKKKKHYLIFTSYIFINSFFSI